MFYDHYPYTNFHNVNLDWVLQAVKAWGHTVEVNDQAFQDLEAANASFKAFVTGYLQNLDVSDEINEKLDQMLADGVLTPYMVPYIQTDVSAWLTQHITPTTPAVDNSLTVSGAAADAKTTGIRFSLLCNVVPNTSQVVTMSGGRVTRIEHKRENTIVRTDAFTYTAESITETRTLNTGASLTMVTNLKTLETTTTYTEV